jgi:hypothetical protein
MKLIKECVWLPTEVSEQAEWIDDPYILPKKSKNQTCNMFLADMTPHIFISQILRWKTQFPEAFSDRESRLSLCTYYSGQFYKILRRKMANTMNFFNFSTNNFDLKQKWPEYISSFVKFYNSQNITKHSNQSRNILWENV